MSAPLHVALYGYFGFANTGDEAILHGMVRQFRRLQRTHSELELCVFSGNPIQTRRVHGVEAVHSVVPASLADAGRGLRGVRPRRFAQAIHAFLRADVFVVGGGGLFYDSAGGNGYLLQLLARMRAAKRLGKRVVALGVGVGPLHSEQSREEIRRTFAQADLVLVRDAESVAELARCGLDVETLHQTGDCAYLLEVESETAIDRIVAQEALEPRGRPRVGISLCAEELANPRTRGTLIRFCRHLLDRLDVDLCFLPLQTHRLFDDRTAGESVATQLGLGERVSVVRGAYESWEMLGLLSRLDAVVSMRLHGAILALASAVPVLGISYMPKVERAFNEIGHPEWQVPLSGLRSDGLAAAFTTIWERRAAVREELERVRQRLRAAALLNFDHFERAFLTEPAGAEARTISSR